MMDFFLELKHLLDEKKKAENESAIFLLNTYLKNIMNCEVKKKNYKLVSR